MIRSTTFHVLGLAVAIAGCSPTEPRPSPETADAAKAVAGERDGPPEPLPTKAEPRPEAPLEDESADAPEPEGPGPAADATPDARTKTVLALLTDGKTAGALTEVATDSGKFFDPGLVDRLAPREVKAQVRIENPDVDGDLDENIVRRVVRSRTAVLRNCYEDGLGLDVTLGGRVTLFFKIGADGKPSGARVENTNLGNEAVGECMAKAVSALRFPKPPGGNAVNVSLPIDVTNAG